MDKSFKIFNWIQARYKHYDKINGKYSGDRYTKKIFNEAAKLFDMTYEEINQEYGKCIAHMTKKVMDDKYRDDKDVREFIRSYEADPESIKATKLHNKKVKLNVDKILEDKTRTLNEFIAFVKSSRDTIFTAQTDEKMSVMYNLKESEVWLFHEDDLIEVEDSEK